MAFTPHAIGSGPADALQLGAAYTAEVTRSDHTGVWVTPVGDDTRSPLGPCRGLHSEDLPAGSVVLLILTAAGPWVAAHDQS